MLLHNGNIQFFLWPGLCKHSCASGCQENNQTVISATIPAHKGCQALLLIVSVRETIQREWMQSTLSSANAVWSHLAVEFPKGKKSSQVITFCQSKQIIFLALCPAFQEAGKGQETIYIPIGKLLNLLKSWLCWQLTGDNVGPNGCSSRPAERWVRLQETDKRKVHQGNSSLKKIYFLIFFYWSIFCDLQ